MAVRTPPGTLILPNYNNERALPHAFAALRAYADCSRLAFVMVDDGSEDASVAVAKEQAPACGFASCEIIERAHEGIVPTLNTALEAARTEWIIRIDGDATFDILREVREEGPPKPGDETTVYTAEDIRIQQYGDTAIVAFRLVSTSDKAGKKEVKNYLNTGTFLKRTGKWQAVSWHATAVPKAPTPTPEPKKSAERS